MTPTPSKPPSLLRNPLSIVGLFVTIVATAFGLPLMFLDMLSRKAHPYVAVVVYLVLPLVAMGGVALAVLGALWERRRRHRTPGVAIPPMPRIDLNEPAHQAAAIGGLFVLIVIGVLLSVTAYQAYHFTESVKFCGLVCHQVMKPEFTAYQYSPHARVACTACHVGPGASWFVRSKLSGLYQVYAVASNTYPRPIPTPVKQLRPAPQTCEQCHWPSKFFGAQQKTIVHHLSDESNSPWQITLLMKIGGGDPKTGAVGGIHWHMNIAKDIEYIAADASREVIPWVRVRERDGRETVYQSAESPLTPQQMARTEIRRMDCVDCHNRPSHIYHPPDAAVDAAMEAGQLDARLPYLKREATRLVGADYRTEAEAMEAIRAGLVAFYQAHYPDLLQTHPDVVRQAAEATARLYARNRFPEMRADWRVHPNHIGHLNSDGCFRCHDGLHTSAAGQVITKDCATCHTIIAQGAPEEVRGTPLHEQPFRHPVDMGMDVTEFKCSQCHNGTGGP